MWIVSRGGSEFQPLPWRDFDHRVLASHQLGSAFADGKADVVAAVNWFLDNLGCDTLGKALIIDEFWHGPTKCTDWWKVLNAYNLGAL
jgi:hypothetical protein